MKNRLFVLLALAAFSTSCTEEIGGPSPDVREQQMLMTKLVGGSQGEIVPGTLLVKLDEAASPSSLTGLEGIRFAKAIPATPRNPEVAAKYGLHQWYRADFDPQTTPEKVAARLAASPEVLSVQYSRIIEPIASEKVYQLDAVPATRSGDAGFPFDDPFVSHQWNLINDGSASGSVAGADVGVKDAWKLTGGDPSVIVAVFDCAVSYRHEDLADAVWKNEAEVNGTADVDDDGNGFIDDKYGFNFVNCFVLDEDYVDGALDGKKLAAVDGQPISSHKGTGHGTHVAGIIGATNGNGKGVSSIAGGTGNGDGVRLMTCQIYEGTSYCTDAQVAAAFIYAADNGACIAQCSYGNYNIITSDEDYINGTDKINGSPLENAALKYFLDPANSNHTSLEGNMAVFAAGNHSNPYSGYPGALPYVISVTAFGNDYRPGSYTNYGPGCKIAAPGGEFGGKVGDYSGMILSTGVTNAATPSPGVETSKGENKNYVYMQGTSMACPHVSGVLALGISYAKKLGKKFSRDEMTSMLLTSVNDIDPFITVDKYKGAMGTGAVDAWRFLMAIEGTPSILVKAGEPCSIDLSEHFGGNAGDLEYLSVTMVGDTKNSLGLTADPMIKDGKLEMSCTKVGAGKISITATIGRDKDMEDGIGGMEFTREVSVVARPFASSNGGWL